jgi:DNA-binding protein H-NS
MSLTRTSPKDPAAETSPSPKPPKPEKAPDITGLSDDDLTALIEAAQTELSSRRERKRAEFLANVREQARALGFDAAEVAAAFATKGKRASADKRGAVAPKYRNPANPAETWAGRGAKPKWVADALGAGKQLDDLKIPPA